MWKMNHILVVDDEPEIRQLIHFHLEHADLDVTEAVSGKQAIELLQTHQIELIILDLMMDDGNGFELLQFLKDTGMTPPVIALSARKEIELKIKTLGLGADDYVTKPFSPIELVARVQAHLRRSQHNSTHTAHIIRLNKLTLDIDNLLLKNDGVQHTLTPLECELLQFFMKNPDRVLTKREIYSQIWQHEQYDDNNLSVFISRLRKMLVRQNGLQPHLQNVRGIGYRFSGDGL